MTRSLPALIALSALALSACASSPIYGPAQSASDFGYRDQQIETDRYRVTYQAADFSASFDGALRRAAELTVAAGYDHFTVVDRSTDTVADRNFGPTIGIGGATGSRNANVGIGVQVPLGAERRAAITRLEILMGRGPKPPRQESYNAREVLGNLQ